LGTDTVLLKVKTPLCLLGTFSSTNASTAATVDHKTYLDSTWNKNAELEVEFMCMDGMEKVVRFIVPLQDENTQSPFFNQPMYDLITEPCYNGTHQEACPLNFEIPIYVTDADRELKNAETNFDIDNDLIRVTSTVQDASTNADRSDRSFHEHRISVHLYLKQNDLFSNGDTFSFTLRAYNTCKSPTGKRLYGETTVRIIFGYTPLPENPTELALPLFSSSVYHATITDILQGQQGHELENIKPSKMFASLASTRRGTKGYGGGEERQKVRYAMQGKNTFTIDPSTGNVSFLRDLSEESWNTVETYEVTALVESYEFLNSSVSLVVFYDFGGGTEGSVHCSNPTTSQPPTTCPICPIICPPTSGKQNI
jgi:hypothetical protein